MSSQANDRQVGGSHYQDAAGTCPHCGGVIQHWDLFGKMPYLMVQVTKYVIRFLGKNGEQDLDKAEHYLKKLREVYYPKKEEVKFKDEVVGGTDAMDWEVEGVGGADVITYIRQADEILPPSSVLEDVQRGAMEADEILPKDY